ncbi:extracellular solute-binding protein [Thioclava kandeliae]|uniref:Extracellular solute-binding protein n=1 Tax=Thioclava kandeliae TaxID=3070818 RepID=A0ABV1SM53_9RHOB
MTRPYTLAALLVGSTIAAQALVSKAHAENIVVSGYGGLWSETFETCFAAPYREKTGNTVSITLGAPNQWVNQLAAATGKPPIDLLMISSSGALDAIDKGLVEPIDEARVPNYARIDPQFRDFTKGLGSVYVYGAMGLTYDTRTVETPPATWEDFVEGTVEGKWRASIPGLNYGSSGLASTVWMLEHVAGGNTDNVDHAIEDIRRMRASGNLIFWNNANDFINQISSGEADIGMYWDGRSWAFIDDGHPEIAYANPAPGSVAAMTWVQKLKGSPDTAWDLMNIILSAEGQSCYTEKMRYGMSNMDVTYSPEVTPQITKLDEIVIPPFAEITAELPKWVDQWNRTIQ